MKLLPQSYKLLRSQPGANFSLAVLVRVKNERAALPEFWRRLSSQTIFSEIEILFLDSGSTDGTLEFLQQLPVSLYQIAPGDFCFGSSCNLLMSLSQAPIAAFFSGHVLLDQPDALEKMRSLLREHAYGAAYLRQVPNTLWGASRYEKAYLARRFPSGATFDVEMRVPGAFSNAGSGLTRAAWQRNPFPEIHGSEDYLWAQKHLALGGRLFYLPGLTILHSHNESPDAMFQRVRLNVISRQIKPSYFLAAYYFGGVFVSLLRRGASLSEARCYASAHARAYLPAGAR